MSSELKNARDRLWGFMNLLEEYEEDGKTISETSYKQAKGQVNDCIEMLREIEDLLEEVRPE